MRLRLQYSPDPEHAALLACLAVDAAKNVDRVVLDYTPESLAHVDRIVESFRTEGLTETDVGETVFSFGCYVGEVLVRSLNGRWKLPHHTQLAQHLKGDENIMVVELPDRSVWNPIGKTFKLLANGSTDSVAYFYHVVTNPEG